MKSYEILDSESKRNVGVLIYYEKKKDFIIELSEDLDEWTAPLLFCNLIKRNIYTVPRNLSLLWVKERIIPAGRQNIEMILKNHKLETYDEMKFLEISKGKCSQDSLYIKKSNCLPLYVTDRAQRNITECIPCKDGNLLCFFVCGIIKKIDIKDVISPDEACKIMKNEALFNSCEVGTGGYFVSFDNAIDISARVLYESGVTIPLTREDFISFVQRNLPDTSECCNLMGCSRQNISYMIKNKQLKEVKSNVKGNLYMKGDVLSTTW